MTKQIATREAYGEILVEIGKNDERIVVLDADLSGSTKTSGFAKAFPERFFDMGIAEQNMIGTASGLATCGKIPFASSFAIFVVGRAFEQVRNSVAYPKLNVKIAATHAGITVGEDGGSHQSIEDIALMRALPNMTVLVPSDAISTKEAVKTALKIEGPVYIRLGRSGVPMVHKEDFSMELGKAVVLKEGKDVTIVATGIMVAMALEASDLLEKESILAQVLEIHTIKPLDKEALVLAAKKTNALVVAEEHSIVGGLGSAVAEALMEEYPVPLKRLGVPDVFGESGSPKELLQKYNLTSLGIVEAVKKVLKDKKQ